MPQDINDAVTDLHNIARDLLEKAQSLSVAAEEGEEALGEVRDLLGTLCRGLEAAVVALRQGEPLRRFLTLVEGVEYRSAARDALTMFLETHARRLLALGISQQAVDGLTSALMNIDQDSAVLVDRKTMDDMISSLDELKSRVCALVPDLDKLDKRRQLLGAAATGARGAATIVFDVTGVLTVPDVTGVVLFHAAWSTLRGARLVGKALGMFGPGPNVPRQPLIVPPPPHDRYKLKSRRRPKSDG